MSFINKNASIVLLVFLLISAAALVGATVFFQLNFDKINNEYSAKISQLKQASEELQVQQELLSKVKEELALKSAREEEFSEKFSSVRSEKEALASEKSKLEAQKKSLTKELEDTESELLAAKSEIESKKEIINNLNADIAQLQLDFDACVDKKDEYKADLEECQQKLANCNCSG
ncbi:hypothetical protein B6U93_01025 [Candidatus Woesearchaeota archaeon ex4484_78]|nr:MAG: hypothetical protein B6U93_01025 [Candidatus Woesearchaeota archaeon ex4484_78]